MHSIFLKHTFPAKQTAVRALLRASESNARTGSITFKPVFLNSSAKPCTCSKSAFVLTHLMIFIISLKSFNLSTKALVWTRQTICITMCCFNQTYSMALGAARLSRDWNPRQNIYDMVSVCVQLCIKPGLESPDVLLVSKTIYSFVLKGKWCFVLELQHLQTIILLLVAMFLVYWAFEVFEMLVVGLPHWSASGYSTNGTALLPLKGAKLHRHIDKTNHLSSRTMPTFLS